MATRSDMPNSKSPSEPVAPRTAAAPGAHASAEMLSQPQSWEKCLAALPQSQEFQTVCDSYPTNVPWLFIGCGSSYYISLSAAACWTYITGRPARAIPASELLLYPDIALQDGRACVSVLISRSGRTSEILKAAELLRARPGHPILAVTCAEDQTLEKLSSATLHFFEAAELSTVMTRSFTSMLLGLQYLAASIAGNKYATQAIMALPALSRKIFDSAATKIPAFVQDRSFDDFIFLGQGPFYGIACECALKVTEMSGSHAQAYHTLEFRHGPKSIVGPQTLVVFLLSEKGFDPERRVLEEIKGLGATTIVLANRGSDATIAASDLLIPLELSIPEYAWLPIAAFPGQLLGLHLALRKGLDPDQPRHLSQVVVLED